MEAVGGMRLMEWKPIETAPDMGVFLGCRLSDSGNYHVFRVFGRRFSGEDKFFIPTGVTGVNKGCA